MTNFQPVMTGQGRVFLNSSSDICQTSYDFHACMSVTSLSRSAGDVTSIVCPSKTQFNEFDEVATVQTPATRWTSALSGMLPVNVESPLETIERDGISFNMQVHYGECGVPTNFNDFVNALVFSNTLLTSYTLGELNALTADAITSVPESADVSVRDYFRVFNLEFGVTFTTAANLILDIGWCRQPLCTSGVASYLGIGLGYDASLIGGQPTFHISTDDGDTWSTVTVSGDGTAATPQEMGFHCVNDDVIYYYGYDVTTGSAIYRTSLTSIISGTPVGTLLLGTADFTEYIRASFESDTHVYFVGGDTGLSALGGSYGVAYDKFDGTVSVFDQHQLFPNTASIAGVRWQSGTAFDSDHALIVGLQLPPATIGAPYAFSTTFGNFTTGNVLLNGVPVTEPAVYAHMFSETEWMLALGDGKIVCTSDSGRTWRLVRTLPANEIPSNRDDVFKDVLSYSVTTSGIYRTLDFNASRVVVHQPNSTFTFGFETAIHPTNPNLVLVTVPTALNTADILVGRP